MFRRVILAGASVIALTAAANAADLSQAPSAVSYKDAPSYGVNWSGLYVGVNGGDGGIPAISPTKSRPVWVSNRKAASGAVRSVIMCKRTNSFSASKLTSRAPASRHKSQLLPPNAPADRGFTLTDKSTLDWFGTVRGRVGYAFDRTLVYAMGGLAYGHIADEDILH